MSQHLGKEKRLLRIVNFLLLWPASLFGLRTRSTLGDHEVFNRLIRVAQSDTTMKDSILRLARLPSETRHASLSILLRQLEAKGAPRDLVEAVQSLQKEKVAQDILQYLEDPNDGRVKTKDHT